MRYRMVRLQPLWWLQLWWSFVSQTTSSIIIFFEKEKEVSPEEQTPRNNRKCILVNVKNVFWRQKITENVRTFHLTALKTQLPHQLLACQSGTENSYVLHGDNVSQPAYPVAVARTPRLVLPYATMHAIYKRQRKIENSWNAIHTK